MQMNTSGFLTSGSMHKMPFDRPFPSSCLPPLQSEFNDGNKFHFACELKTNLLKKHFALRLALKRRQT